MKQTTKRALNDIVESHLTSVISNSISIARHSKRRRRTIHASDILTALRIQGTPLQLPTNAGYTDNSPVDLNDFLEKESDPEIDTPSELGVVMHWLAVEGVQPRTQLNPVHIVQAAATTGHEVASDNVTIDGKGTGPQDSNNYRVTENIENNQAQANLRRDQILKNVTSPVSSQGLDPTDSSSSSNTDNVTIRNLLPRLLSEELQLYFIRITLALQKSNTQSQDAAFSRLRHDSGIQELIPFFLNFLTPTSNAQMSNVQQSLTRIYCVHNIVQNPNLHLELYLEKIVPLVLNCIIPKKLSMNHYDHWKLRDVAASALLSIWRIFGEKYTSFQSSVIRVLCQALTHGVESRYGALVALSGLGPKVVDAVIMPYIGDFWVDSERQLEKCDSEGVRFGVYRLQDALLYAMSVFLGSGVTNRINSLDGEKGSEIFGDKLVPLSRHDSQSEYFNCFI